MEKNTVILDLGVYQKMVKELNAFKSGKKVVVKSWAAHYLLEIYTDDELIKELGNKITKLDDLSQNLEKQLNKIKDDQIKEETNPDNILILKKDLKKMSYWKFRKLKKL